MSRLEIFVRKNNKRTNFAVAIGLIKSNNSFFKEIVIKDDAKNAVFSLVKKFKEKGISFSEIVLSGTENYFASTPLATHVTVLKKPELFFLDFVELKEEASKFKKENKEKYNFYKTKTKPKITTKQLGDRAETIVANYLKSTGHQILARNHKTRFYEIDIISTKNDKIYFTEVKYRKNESRGTSFEMITKKKLEQMTFAAESFLKLRKDLKEKYSPLLAVASVSGENFTFNGWFPLS